jgi:hypothetical protein
MLEKRAEGSGLGTALGGAGTSASNAKYAVALEAEVEGGKEKLRVAESNLEGWKSKHFILTESMEWKQTLHDEQLEHLAVGAIRVGLFIRTCIYLVLYAYT